jgi:UDP-glucuronate decarboxylase
LSGSLKLAKSLLFEDGISAWGSLSHELIRGRRVLVTGASGLLGAHFLATLLHLKQEFMGDLEIDAIVHTSIPDWFVEEAADGKIHFIQADLENSAAVDALPEADIVIHSATYSQPAMFTQDPVATIRLNTTATLSLLDKVKPGGRFLFLSSSEVYSGLENPPYREEQIGLTNTTHPRACYIEGKRCGEAACYSYHRDDIQARSARLCLAYGPGTRQGDRRALNTFVERALQDGCIRLMDDGASRRTYCYIADAMFMLWRILLCGKQPLYNVGGLWSTTILELARSIGRILNVPVSVPECLAAQGVLGAPKEVSVDCTRFQDEFGPLTFVQPEHGLERTISWQKSLYRQA